MNLNRIIFPAPRSSYSKSSLGESLVWIPEQTKRIPCLYLPCPHGSSKTLLYFHGNAEDIGLTYDLMDHLRSTLGVHILAVEYPGYGLYEGSASAAQLIQDAEKVYEYLTKAVGVNAKNIIVLGRSIGSGPATWLAAHKPVGVLALMSAYTSIRAVVRHIVGSLLQYLVKERFKNIDLMDKVTCPTFILHGQKDKLIPYRYSQMLHEACNGPSCLELPKDMDHNTFDFFGDLSVPFSAFLRHCGVKVDPERGNSGFLKLCN